MKITAYLRSVVFIALAAAIVMLPGGAVRATSGVGHKMDLPLRMLVERPDAGKAMLGKAVSLRDGIEQADVLVKSDDVATTAAAIEGAGGTVRSTVGNIMTAFIPVDSIEGISSRDEVEALEASRQMKFLMDTARSSDNTNVASVQSQYDGANVVVGAIDSGLDYSRSDFDASGGGTRVQYLRFQSASGTSISAVECANDTIDAGNCSIGANNDSQVGHGTHVTGIAAGSNSKYTGVAPAADIMMVRNDYDDDLNEGGGTFSGGIIDGVTEIFKKSDILDKPAVINISQGTHIGAHDNTSLMEQALNSAVQGGYASGGKSYGRAIVVAAGNEHVVAAGLGDFANNAGGIHAPISVTSGSSKAWRFWVLDSSGPARTPLIADAWFGSGQGGNCTIAANVYAYPDVFDAGTLNPKAGVLTTAAKFAVPDMPLSADASNQGSDAVASVTIATDSSDSQNNKPRALIQYGPTGGGSWNQIALANGPTANTNFYVLDLIVRASGGNCSGDMWIEGGGSLVNFMKNIDTGTIGNGANGDGYALGTGDSLKTVDIPATASGVIAVGAYLQIKPVAGCSDSCWIDEDGVPHDATNPAAADAAQAQINGGIPGDRTPFSSIGPAVYSYSGHKPDVLAPGDPIISVLPTGFTPSFEGATNRTVIVDSTHYKLQGTSQASPHVAGMVALLFQKNNTLTAAQAKQALTSTATLASNPNDNDGYGKVLAPGAMSSVSADTTGYKGTGNLTQAEIDGGGGSTSSGGCGGMLVPSSGGAGIAALAILIPLAGIAARRKIR